MESWRADSFPWYKDLKVEVSESLLSIQNLDHPRLYTCTLLRNLFHDCHVR